MADNADFTGWACVEVMGHNTHFGMVTTEMYGGVAMFRVDQPEVPEEEETLKQIEYYNGTRMAEGSVVKRARIPAASALIGAASIYRIIPCDEATAMMMIRKKADTRPLLIVKMAGVPLLQGAMAIICPECAATLNSNGECPYADDHSL